MSFTALARSVYSLCPLTNERICGHDLPETTVRKTTKSVGCNASLRLFHFLAGQKSYECTKKLYTRFITDHYYDARSVPLRPSDVDSLLVEPSHPHKANVFNASVLRFLSRTAGRHIIILGSWNGTRTHVMASSIIDFQEQYSLPPVLMMITRNRHVAFALEADHAELLSSVNLPSIHLSPPVVIRPHSKDFIPSLLGRLGIRTKSALAPTASFSELLTCQQTPEWNGEKGMLFVSVASQPTDRRDAKFSSQKMTYHWWFSVGKCRANDVRVFLINPVLEGTKSWAQGRFSRVFSFPR